MANKKVRTRMVSRKPAAQMPERSPSTNHTPHTATTVFRKMNVQAADVLVQQQRRPADRLDQQQVHRALAEHVGDEERGDDDADQHGDGRADVADDDMFR